MDGEQVEVPMKGGQHFSNLSLLKISSSRCKHEITVYNGPSKEVRFEAQTNCGHFSNSQGSIFHVLSPSIHRLLKLRKIFRDYVRRVIYLPHVSPLRIALGL